jgi:GNAT superfamily N-acetyltransferase
MSLRRARPSDLAVLMTMAEGYAAADGHRWDEATARAGFGPLLESDRHGLVWLILDPQDEVAGYAVVTWGWSVESGGADALLDEIFVSHPGRGLGGGAVAEIIEDCRHRGLPRIFLETEAGNERARRLYARHGFEAESSVWMVKRL